MSSIVCMSDTAASPNLIRIDVLDPNLYDNIRQGNMPDIHSAQDTKLKVSRTITFHLLMGESRARVNFGVVKKLVVPALLGKKYICRFTKSVDLVERKVVPHHSPPVPILMKYEVPGEAENNKSDIFQDTTGDLELLAKMNKICTTGLNYDGS